MSVEKGDRIAGYVVLGIFIALILWAMVLGIARNYECRETGGVPYRSLCLEQEAVIDDGR